jgi:hypothetical protein
MIRQSVSIVCVLATGLALGGCSRTIAREFTGHRVAPQSLASLQLDSTTSAEIEQQFGEPDERAPDGTLTYRYQSIRHDRPRFAGLTVPFTAGNNEIIEHTVEFHFENGVLSRICRTRALAGQAVPSEPHS